MKIGFNKIEVNSEAGYEALYRGVERKFKSCARAVAILLAIHLVFMLIIAGIGLIAFDSLGYVIVTGVQSTLISLFSEPRWHLEVDHNYLNINPVKQPTILPYWAAVLGTVLVVISIIVGIGTFFSEVFYDYRYTGFWPYIVEGILNLLCAIVMCFVLHYLQQYFRWYRWTWEELQLSLNERKAQYKEKRLAEKQRMKEVREELRRKAEVSRTENSGFLAKRNEKHAAKTVKSQADRRAELENLKKLYDEGLIDEEEYKKAREKALDIQ